MLNEFVITLLIATQLPVYWREYFLMYFVQTMITYSCEQKCDYFYIQIIMFILFLRIILVLLISKLPVP